MGRINVANLGDDSNRQVGLIYYYNIFLHIQFFTTKSECTDLNNCSMHVFKSM